jgi:hypothetical protein
MPTSFRSRDARNVDPRLEFGETHRVSLSASPCRYALTRSALSSKLEPASPRDCIPVIGFADNAVVLVWALRSTIRVAGTDAVEQHWTGTPEALNLIYRAARLQPSPPEAS